jgi:hypothetical protein
LTLASFGGESSFLERKPKTKSNKKETTMRSQYRHQLFAFVLGLSICTLALGCDSSGGSKAMDAGRDIVSSSSDAPSPSPDTMNVAGNTGTAGQSGSTGAGGMGHGGTAGSATDAGAAGSGDTDAMVDAKVSEDVFGELISSVNPSDSPCPSDGHQFCYHDVGGQPGIQGTCLGLLCCYGCIKNGVCHRGNEQTLCAAHGFACAECGVTPGNETLPTCKPIDFRPYPIGFQWTCQK